MNYEEFGKYIDITDNKFVKKYKNAEGNEFFIEPAFYTQLLGLKERYLDSYKKVVEEMYKLIAKYKRIAFVYDFENPFLDYGEVVLREFSDVTDAVKVFYEDKSRGSDYGD